MLRDNACQSRGLTAKTALRRAVTAPSRGPDERVSANKAITNERPMRFTAA